MRVVLRSNLLTQAANDLKILNEIKDSDEMERYKVQSDIIWSNTISKMDEVFKRVSLNTKMLYGFDELEMKQWDELHKGFPEAVRAFNTKEAL